MNIGSIRQLVDTFTKEELQNAETALMEEQPLAVEVPGIDDGERLTHLIAAVWVHNHMTEHSSDAMTAIREYTKRVRQSIS